jgi:hypothetical protein
VDYPIHTGNVEIETASGLLGQQTAHALEVITNRPNYRLPFEALVNFRTFIPSLPTTPSGLLLSPSQFSAAKINFIETNFIHSTNEFGDENASGFSTLSRAEAGPQVYAQWKGEIKPQFEMAMNNFLGETC